MAIANKLESFGPAHKQSWMKVVASLYGGFGAPESLPEEMQERANELYSQDFPAWRAAEVLVFYRPTPPEPDLVFVTPRG